MDRLKDSIRDLPSKSSIVKIRSLFHTLAHGDDTDYEEFENREGDIRTFRENDKAFRVFGTGVHVKIGAYLAALIGLTLTVGFCFFYSLYHNRGQGRNSFLDHIELIDLIYAFLVGIPCHIILAIGILQERKSFFAPFIVFYASNFVLNIFFTFLTIGWTSAQALAIYVVFKCRRYVAAKNHFKANQVSIPYSVSTA